MPKEAAGSSKMDGRLWLDLVSKLVIGDLDENSSILEGVEGTLDCPKIKR